MKLLTLIHGTPCYTSYFSCVGGSSGCRLLGDQGAKIRIIHFKYTIRTIFLYLYSICLSTQVYIHTHTPLNHSWVTVHLVISHCSGEITFQNSIHPLPLQSTHHVNHKHCKSTLSAVPGKLTGLVYVPQQGICVRFSSVRKKIK